MSTSEPCHLSRMTFIRLKTSGSALNNNNMKTAYRIHVKIKGSKEDYVIFLWTKGKASLGEISKAIEASPFEGEIEGFEAFQLNAEQVKLLKKIQRKPNSKSDEQF